MYVYIAGPYTGGDVGANMAAAMTAWHDLADQGHIPFCPHLSHFLHIHRQRPYEDWMEQGLAWLDCCDALLRLPGESSGADREEAYATKVGMPVYHSVAELVAREKEVHPW